MTDKKRKRLDTDIPSIQRAYDNNTKRKKCTSVSKRTAKSLEADDEVYANMTDYLEEINNRKDEFKQITRIDMCDKLGVLSKKMEQNTQVHKQNNIIESAKRTTQDPKQLTTEKMLQTLKSCITRVSKKYSQPLLVNNIVVFNAFKSDTQFNDTWNDIQGTLYKTCDQVDLLETSNLNRDVDILINASLEMLEQTLSEYHENGSIKCVRHNTNTICSNMVLYTAESIFHAENIDTVLNIPYCTNNTNKYLANLHKINDVLFFGGNNWKVISYYKLQDSVCFEEYMLITSSTIHHKFIFSTDEEGNHDKLLQWEQTILNKNNNGNDFGIGRSLINYVRKEWFIKTLDQYILIKTSN